MSSNVVTFNQGEGKLTHISLIFATFFLRELSFHIVIGVKRKIFIEQLFIIHMLPNKHRPKKEKHGALSPLIILDVNGNKPLMQTWKN